MFFAESSGFAGLFSALGLNWQTFILDALAFLVTVWILGKYVYPHLIKALDAKQGELEAAARLEQQAKSSLTEAEGKAGEIVTEARKAAEEVLASAHATANDQIEEARTKAASQVERLMSEGREQLSRDVLAARQALKSDTQKLVASATETILDEKLDDHKDGELIRRSLDAGKEGARG